MTTIVRTELGALFVLAWVNNVTLSGTFECPFSDTTRGYGGKDMVRYLWQ